MYKRILVAVDGSENSKRAAGHAAKLAGLSKETHVEILYVQDFERIQSDAQQKSRATTIDNERQKRLAPIRGVFEQPLVSHELIVKQGEPGSTIVSFANRGGFDLVVIGSRGLNSFQEMVIGSVSQKVAKRVNAPVMIVK
ncbi:universal stress protein [Sporosarcina sp. Marseille-Q4063]|uniref:universal stress protein n=1 Tax=Sporosarcina sp. Marseille-Q4063 TaxID=2810514 RepID=UPI001BB0892A|nr:universal stress protein [Sporosarcina sp. Marseille-Q4063]QUW23757.1 universal stress protein [Sporosarcina sp. Marseille-Q4063]